MVSELNLKKTGIKKSVEKHYIMLGNKENYLEAIARVIWFLELRALTYPNTHTYNLRKLENF